MEKLVVSDIFGRTPGLEELCCSIEGNYDIVDPYNGEFIDFDDEAHAYQYFSQQVGAAKYSQMLMAKINDSQHIVSLLGFSVGASAIWLCSQQVTEGQVSGALGLYGSQIRHYLSVNPKVTIQLLLPKAETHFSIAALAEKLVIIDGVKLSHSQYFHGFANRLSSNFNHTGYQHLTSSLSCLKANQCFSELNFKN